ncbi:MAG: hypothetical protein ACSLE0_05800 [Chitinophagaceae bacterium]
MKENEYRLDRNAFQMLSFEEADKEMSKPGNWTKDDRFRYFNYLVSVAYRFLGEEWPEMDKTFFEMRKR